MTDVERIASGLAKIGLVLRHHAWSAGEQSGLTPTQGQVLSQLLARDRPAGPGGQTADEGGEAEGGATVSELAAELAVSLPTVSDVVSALVRKGLVVKTRSTQDARVQRVGLTPSGRDAARAEAVWPGELLAAAELLGESERAAMLRSLVTIILSLQRLGRIPFGRMCPTCVHFRPNAHDGSATEGKRHHCAYVDRPIGDGDLRLDCREHTLQDAPGRERLWEVFVGGKPMKTPAVPASATATEDAPGI